MDVFARPGITATPLTGVQIREIPGSWGRQKQEQRGLSPLSFCYVKATDGPSQGALPLRVLICAFKTSLCR